MTGSSSFLPVSVRGIAGTAATVSGTWRGESALAQRRGDPRAQRVVELDAIGEHDEQDQLAGPPSAILEVHDETVGTSVEPSITG